MLSKETVAFKDLENRAYTVYQLASMQFPAGGAKGGHWRAHSDSTDMRAQGSDIGHAARALTATKGRKRPTKASFSWYVAGMSEGSVTHAMFAHPSFSVSWDDVAFLATL